MSCRVEYNQKGQIERVLAPDGNESQLYNQLAKIPQISQEDALNAYAEQLVEYEAIDTKTGRSHIFKQGGTKLGVIRTKRINSESETIDMVNVHQDYRGQGIGTELYLETTRNLMAQGKVLKSDKHQTEFAKRIWENLVSQGLAVKTGESQYETVLVEGFTIENSIDDIEIKDGKAVLKDTIMYNITGVKSANIYGLETAKEMLVNNSDMLAIKLATGWELGTDGRWKRELPKNAKLKRFNTESSTTLGAILDYPELFEAYPQLRKTKINFYSDNSNTKMFVLEGEININTNNNEDTRGSLLHEVQHLIQDLEGTSEGTNSRWTEQSFRNAYDENGNPNRESGIQGELIRNWFQKTFEPLGYTVKDFLDDSVAMKTLALKMYETNFGEVEARNVEKRSNFSGYKNTLLKETEDILPEYLWYKVDGRFYPNLKQALYNSNGSNISVVNVSNTGVSELASFSSNTNPDTELGFINNLVKNGLVSESAVIEQGEKFLVFDGYSSEAQIMNQQVAEQFGWSSGNKLNSTFDGRFKIEDLKTFRNFQGKTFSEIKKDLGEDLALVVGGIQAIYSELTLKRPNKKAFIASEETLRQQIFALFEKTGFSIQTLEEYKEKYKNKHGDLPNIGALIDLSNQVVAFKDGRIETEMLTEEFAHFILEALPQEGLENLLRNVHKTQEYKDNYHLYYDAYNGNEEMIRKEMLGKVLANGLQGKTQGISQNIFEQLWEMIQEFFLGITPYHKEAQELTNRVSDLLITQDLGSLENISEKKFRMYNMESSGSSFIDEGKAKATRVLEYLEAMNTKLRRSNADATIIKENLAKADEALLERSIFSILDLASRQVRYVEEAISDATARQDIITQEERLVMINLKNTVLPALGGLSNASKNQGIQNEIKEISNRINRLPAEITPEITLKIVDRIISHGNFPEKVKINGVEVESRQFLVDALTEAVSDTNFVWSWFGQMSHTHDPLLNMTSMVISDMMSRANARYVNGAKNFQNKVKGNEKDLKRFTKNGYIESLWDFEQLDKDLLQNEIDVLKEISGKDVNEENKNEILETVNQNEFKEKLAKKNRGLFERQFTDEYYDKLEKSLEGLSEITKSKMQQFFEDRRSIWEKIKRDSKNRPIFNRQDKINLEEFNRQRTLAKSPFDYQGELKQGLEFSAVFKSGFEKVNGGFIGIKPNASSEAIVAFEMTKMDNKFFQEKSWEKLSKIVGKNIDGTNFDIELSNLTEKQKEEYYKSDIDGLSDEFINNLTDADSFFANVRLSFVDSFWDSPLEDPLKDYVDNEADLDFLEKYEVYQKLVSRRKNMLKEFQDSKNATNIMGDRMSKTTQDEIRSLTDDILNMRELLYKEADIKIDYSTLEENDLTESEPNQSYWGWIKDNGWENSKYSIFEQSLKHVPNNKKSRLESIIYSLNAIREQKATTGLDLKRVEKEFGLSKEDILRLSEDQLLDLKINAVQKRLAPYYKSFAPKGLNEVLRRMEQPGADIKAGVKELQKIEALKMAMHSSYYDLQDTRTINPNWIPEYKASRRQPSNKYISKEFVSKYNPKRDSNGNFMFDENGLPILADTKENNLYKAVVDYKRESLENLGEIGKSNLYEMPQISKTKLDKIESIIKGRKGAVNILKEWGSELISFRVDEQALGEEDADGKVLLQSGERVIPKKYLRRLETKEDLSNDLFMTLTLFAKEAELYKARTESLSEIMALEDAFLNRKTYNGKKQESTNSYRMLKNSIDYNIFGTTEVVNHRVNLPFIGTVDLAKLAKVFHKYLRNKNLAYNLIIPATSWLTAEAQIKIERLVGQYLDKDSVRYANKELLKYSQGALTESLSINKNSKLSILGARFGQFDMDKSFENSKYSSVLRTVGKIGYVAHTAGNFTPVMKAMLTGLTGHRIKMNASGTGRFVDFNTFKYESKLEGKSDKQIKAEWDSLRDRSFYSYLNVSEEGVYSVDESRMKQDLNNSEVDINALEDMIGNKIRKFVERIDGSIRPEEKTLLQRHFIGQYLMTHKGWLAIATANRFKAEHFNLLTGQVEEGTYRTVGRKLSDTVLGLFNNRKDFEAFKKTFSEVWMNSSPSERTNLKRAAIELGFISVLYAMVLGLSSFADDDDQKDVWATQFAALLSERLVNETKSSQLGIFSELSQTVQEPVVGYKNIVQTLDITKLLSNEDVKRGTYAGLKEWQSYLVKNVVGLKPTYTIWSGENIYTQRKSYQYFNNIEELQPASVFLNKETFK